MNPALVITTITVNEHFKSVFSKETFPRHDRNGMILTDRIEALNLRVRESASGYSTDWHVAGDPTLIIVQQGILRITLRNGESRDFVVGDQFIAKDYLPDSVEFNDNHGHKAEALGKERLRAVHIKLVG